MNWELVKWVAGVLLTCAGIKFVWTAFRAIFSKENMTDALESLGDKCSDAAYSSRKFIKKKIVEHKKRKEVKKDEEKGQVIAYIR